MKSLIFLSLLLFALAPAAAQDSSALEAGEHSGVPAGAFPNIEPAKLADIRRLMEMTGVANLGEQAMRDMETTMRPMLTSAFPSGEYREKLIDLFFVKFHAKAGAELIDLAIPSYDKYFSEQEIQDLIAFYSTALGQKTISVLPKLMQELHEAGKARGAVLGRECMAEVLAENPELAKQLAAAEERAGKEAKSSQP